MGLMETVTLAAPCSVCGAHETERVDAIMVRCGCGNHRPDPSPVPDDWGGYTFEGRCGTPADRPLGLDGPQLVWAETAPQAAQWLAPAFRWLTVWVRRRGTEGWTEYDARGQVVERQGVLDL